MNHPETQRNVVVVIGSGGMGHAIAHRLSRGRTLLIADFSKERLEGAVDLLRNQGHIVDARVVDVSDRGAVEELARVASTLGRIDVVIHTAGVSPVMATARQIHEVDLLGTAHVIDAFYAVSSPGTSLVCIASMAGHFASLPEEFERHLGTAPSDRLLRHPAIDLDSSDSGAAYVIAKRGNQLRVAAASHRWGGRGARLNCISPGVISTSMGQEELRGDSGTHMQAMIDSSGARRIGTPDDIADAAVFLAGPESSFITGIDLLVDGGVVAAQRWAPRSE